MCNAKLTKIIWIKKIRIELKEIIFNYWFFCQTLFAYNYTNALTIHVYNTIIILTIQIDWKLYFLERIFVFAWYVKQWYQ